MASLIQSLLGDWPILAAKPPTSDWVPPSGGLPDLRGVEIGLDTETKDGGLEADRGPGWVYGDGYIAGVSVAWAGGFVYVPTRHPATECRPMSEVARWVDSLLTHCHVDFFNMGYDMGWLGAEGCEVWPERYDDASVMAVMLDENWDTNNLDAVCGRLGIEGKDETLLNQAAIAFGIKKRYGGYKHGLWRLPACYVGPYAEQDAVATLRATRLLRPKIADQGVSEAYRTELDLIPVVKRMRQRGIRIDEEAAHNAKVEVIRQRDAQLAAIRPAKGRRSVVIEDLRSPAKLAEIFDDHGVSYPLTAKTHQPSFTAEWLEDQSTPLASAVRRARQLEDVSSKFIDNYILGFLHRGRVHAEIHPLRTDMGGTVTTRLAYSCPPLQQMPARDPVLGPLVRNMFLAEKGQLWYAPDYSQQEPRLGVHFASICGIRGADEAVAYYRDRGANADFHQMVSDMAGIPRPRAKIINLGLFYGMGLAKLARTLGLSKEDAEDLMKLYHDKVPWVRLLSDFADRRASAKGFIKLIDGARRHFDEWEPASRRSEVGMYRLEKAQAMWPNQPLRRSKTRTAMNGLIQGSAARQTKRAMVGCWRDGSLPLLQMHDEICFSVDNPEECERIERMMIECTPLEVPVKVDAEVGPMWGKAKTNYRDWKWTRS